MQVNTDPGAFQQRMPRDSMLSLNQKQVITGPRNGGLQAGKVDRTARYRILYVRRRQQAAVLDPSSGHAEFLRGLGRELGTEYEFIATNAQKQWRPGARPSSVHIVIEISERVEVAARRGSCGAWCRNRGPVANGCLGPNRGDGLRA